MTSPAAICPILIERDRELALLNRVAAEVDRGTARLVVITGEGGAGKSRLITELVASLDDTWKRTITSASSSRRPFADVISRAEVGPDTPHAEIGRALATAMPTGPTVVVIDDTHLLDGVTLRALGVALDLLEDEPVLILAGFRSGASDVTPALSSSAGIRASSSLSARSRPMESPRWPPRCSIEASMTSSSTR